MQLEFHTLDVFTRTKFGGNPLAVFPDARGLTDAQMQTIAAEFNLPETTFVFPQSDPVCRWFASSRLGWNCPSLVIPLWEPCCWRGLAYSDELQR